MFTQLSISLDWATLILNVDYYEQKGIQQRNQNTSSNQKKFMQLQMYMEAPHMCHFCCYYYT